jgi:AcrR family transcriptional regulator
VIALDSFIALPEEKQETVIGAALAAFGRNGYKKASTADVALAAGISKGMVFHYFGTKKGLYIFLCEHCRKAMGEALSLNGKEADFFARIRQSTALKVELLKKKPHMLEFLKSMYQETDPEVALEVEGFRELIAPAQQALLIEDEDRAKFKDGVDPEQVLKMLTWMGVGASEEMSGASDEKMNELLASFDKCIEIIKNNFYKKEEYL